MEETSERARVRLSKRVKYCDLLGLWRRGLPHDMPPQVEDIVNQEVDWKAIHLRQFNLESYYQVNYKVGPA
jgi:hypothetical protein